MTLTLITALDAAQVADVENDSLVRAGPRGHSRPAAEEIAIKSAVSNTARHTVTLTTARRLPLEDYFKLTVNGAGTSGFTGVSAARLGAAHKAMPGTSVVVLLTATDLAAP